MVDVALRPDGRRERRPVAVASPPEDASAATWAVFVAALLSRTILLVTASLLLWAALPAAWAWIPTTVVSGSMAPQIRPGDVVMAMPVHDRDLAVGQVLLVEDPNRRGTLLLHRLVARTPSGALQLRGDANPTPDVRTVKSEAVRGIGVLRVPLVGLPALWVREHDVGRLAVTALGLVGALVLSSRLSGPTGPDVIRAVRHGRRRRRSARAERIRSVVLIGVLAVVAGVVVANGAAHAAFSATAANTGDRFATGTFACLQRAPFAHTYLTYRFNDAPGTIAADGSGNGHHSTLTPGVSLAPGSCRPGDSPSLLTGGVRGQVVTDVAVDAPQVFAIETWFRTTTTTGGMLLGFGNVQTDQSTRYDRQLYLSDEGAVYFGAYNGTNIAISSAAGLNDGAWHLATATMDASGMRLYVDGRQVATNTNARAEVSTGWWRIGFDNLNGWPGNHTTFHFRGNLDNVAVYDDALTPTAVQEHFAAGR
ncbi:hypothetical protein BIU97_14595 [Curtobacterium sp. MCBA15_009]|uniref:LamG-like jellyroll fold domain-containing protein n=1 Tax=Curtobacterium sp. MCBA15_009 TaxID=1898737 RepID=UPI000911815C|nr:LamG-like jellyroll fold domain-containing protein [Curtobacterium sp. MCBA15_009]OII15396.1 hypothetical protein BIU97_14595 [Curtobacterium sp. MCBA15_009]